jgi:hypothetical protein
MIWFQNRQVNHHNPDFALQQSAGVPGARLTGAIYMFQFDIAGWSRRSGKKRLPRFLTMVEYYPQLNHSTNPFVEFPAEHNFVRQGTAMSEFSDRYFDAGPTVRRIRRIDRAIRHAGLRTPYGLRGSSPWPWILALALSLTMWASLAWLILRK